MEGQEEINKAVKVMKEGGIVIFPTDTAFGIGCRIDNISSVEKLFSLRRRPEHQAVPVLVSSVGMAEKYLLSPLPNNVRRIMKDYWPGGLTVVYKCNLDRVTPQVRGFGQNLGVRMPDSTKILKIIKGVGVPVLGPSANFHGDKTPYSVEDLNPDLVKLVDYVVTGECVIKEASTVIDTALTPWKILRQGKTIIDLNNYQLSTTNYKLFFDTADRNKIVVKLFKDGLLLSKKSRTQKFTSQALLPLIDEICREFKITPSHVSEVEINPGPGSYTGLKVGSAVANAFGWCLKIPVNAKKNKIITPVFE